MKEELKNQCEVVQTSSEGLFAVEQFLKNHYLFRRNVLSGRMEYAILSAKDEPEYPKSDIQDLLCSEEVRAYDHP